MGNGPEVPGEWDSSGPSEPPAQLLRRAISHVESLLHRLETPTEPQTVVVARSEGGPDENPVAADGAASAPESASADASHGDNVVELARTDPAHPGSSGATEGYEPIDVVAPQPSTDAEPAHGSYAPLPGLSSAAQAEALRITLHAHEEAHRLRAEADGLRAEAAAEGERILVEARMLSDRLHVESRESATELLSAARTEAGAIVEAARAEAERIAESAREDAARANAELAARAERERVNATAAALAEAGRQAEQLRASALEEGRAEAARLIEAEVAAAAAEGQRAVEASRSRADELLAAAQDGIEDVRASMRRLLEQMNQALVGFNAAVGPVEQLRSSIQEMAPAGAEVDDPDDGGRRPLGLLFGAPRR